MTRKIEVTVTAKKPGGPSMVFEMDLPPGHPCESYTDTLENAVYEEVRRACPGSDPYDVVDWSYAFINAT